MMLVMTSLVMTQQEEPPEYISGDWIMPLAGGGVIYPTVGMKSSVVVDLALEPGNPDQVWVATADSGISFWGKIDFETRDYYGNLIGPRMNWQYYQTEIFGAGDGQCLTALTRKGEYAWVTNQTLLWIGKVEVNSNYEVASVTWWNVGKVEDGDVIIDLEVDENGHAFITTKQAVYHSTANNTVASWEKVVFPEDVYTFRGTKKLAIDGHGRAFITDYHWVIVINANGGNGFKWTPDESFQVYDITYEPASKKILVLYQMTDWWPTLCRWDTEQDVLESQRSWFMWQNSPVTFIGGPADQAGLYWIGAPSRSIRRWNGGVQNSESVDNASLTGNAHAIKAVRCADKGQTWIINGCDRGIYIFQYDNLNAVEKKQINIQPKEFSLEQNYPNPFNPSTTIEYTIEKSQHVTMKVYNIHGQLVETLVDDSRPAGLHSVRWIPDNGVPSGIYLVLIQTPRQVKITKAVFIK